MINVVYPGDHRHPILKGTSHEIRLRLPKTAILYADWSVCDVQLLPNMVLRPARETVP